MSLLLALTATPIPPDPVPEWVAGGTSGVFPQPQRRTRKAWDWMEKKQEAKPAPVPERKIEVPQLSEAAQTYVDRLSAAVIAAQNAQARALAQIEAAQAEAQRIEAVAAMELAIAQERQAKQEMMDFDIVFVASVLANM